MSYLKKKREELGLNKQDMAELVEIPLTTYVRIELGNLKTQKYSQLEQIADELDMTVDELIINSEEYNKESVQ
ncbi:helix-turn-helix domain-containing protein [Staphylococcus capitis]|uniref:helix-turn-helix domain-containing protein n=1 Tax=Staphylococcus capitis TaxID=29388 RepID=UPI00145A1DAC|nr:helix-turn-helix transcriptional regulator [Staphylococcus capitis]NML00718.1 helix-turn-helix transcriptional regulator [Staphylococcus capitis]